MSKDCYIFTGGQVFADSMAELGLSPADGDIIIAADSGYLTARRLGAVPELLLGDLDSLDRSMVTDAELEKLEKMIVSPIKDDTDTQLAVDTALSRGAERIFIIGGLGGRLDHTLSSVFLLEYIKAAGADCLMTDGRNRVRILCADGELTNLSVKRGYKYLSLVSLTDKSLDVSVSGVFYPLDGVELTRLYSYAVSNEITAELAVISLTRGRLLVIESRD